MASYSDDTPYDSNESSSAFPPDCSPPSKKAAGRAVIYCTGQTIRGESAAEIKASLDGKSCPVCLHAQVPSDEEYSSKQKQLQDKKMQEAEVEAKKANMEALTCPKCNQLYNNPKYVFFY